MPPDSLNRRDRTWRKSEHLSGKLFLRGPLMTKQGKRTIYGILLLLGLRPGADMRRKLVPLARRHAVQTKVAVVVDRTVDRAALILMHVGSDKGRLGRPHWSGEHPRDAIRAVLAREQTVALPLPLE